MSLKLPFNRLCLWLCGKESACQCRRRKRYRFDPWVRKMSCSRKWQPRFTKSRLCKGIFTESLQLAIQGCLQWWSTLWNWVIQQTQQLTQFHFPILPESTIWPMSCFRDQSTTIHYGLLYGLWVGMIFYIFKWLKKFLKNNLSDLSKLKEIQIPIYSERKWSRSAVSSSL